MSSLTELAAVGAAVALAGALERLDAAATPARARRASASGVPLPPVTMPAGPARHAVVGVAAGCGGMLVGSPTLALIVGVIAASISVARVRRASRVRARACEAATPAFARVIADALRGGTSIRAALVGVAGDRSVPEPMRLLVASEAHALAAGAALLTVLHRLAASGGPSLRLCCGTIALHLESGGRLSTELERLAAAADEARRADEDRVAATAQARATVRVVGAMPLLALGGAQLASPGFLAQVAGSPIALALLLLGLVLEIVAFVAARAIVGPAR